MGEEEIARALHEALAQKPLPADFDWQAEMDRVREFEREYPGYITGFSMGTDALRMARAVLALVHPAIERARVEERERCAKIAESPEWELGEHRDTERRDKRKAAAIRKG